MIRFSQGIQNLRSSEIRRLMASAADPTIISFTGGMPNNDLLPVDIIDELWNNLDSNEKKVALQYGPTGGYPPLKNSIKEYLRSRGLPVDENEIIITTGAQQAINLLTKVLVDPDDVVLTEYPSFIGAIAAFNSYSAQCIPVSLDENGIDCGELEEKLYAHKSKVKMLYLCPYFHNPAGIIYSDERKKEVLLLAEKYEVCILEDDPYSELYFDLSTKNLTRSMKSMASKTLPLCYVGTFAKILGPGMRIGYLLGPKEIVEKCELVKQSMDACTSTFTQVLANAFLINGKLQTYLEYVRPIYKRRCSIMLGTLEKYMPDEITWTKALGGFYVWVQMPKAVNAGDVFARCLEKKTAFVIGSAFDPDGKRNNCFRLAFSYTPEKKIEEGIKIISTVVKSFL